MAREKTRRGIQSPHARRNVMSAGGSSLSLDFGALQKRRGEWAEPLFPGGSSESQSAKGPGLPMISARQSRTTVASPERSYKSSRSSRKWSAKVSTDKLYPQSPSRQLRQRNGLGLSGALSTGSRGVESPVQNSPDMTPPGPAAPVPPSETLENPIGVFQRLEEDSCYPVDASQILRMQEYNASRPVSRRPKTVSVIEDWSKPLIIPQESLWPELKNLPNESALEPKPAKRVQSSRSSRRQATEARHVRGPGLRAATAISTRPQKGPDDAFGLTARTVYNARIWTPSMTFPIHTGGRA